jgi:hypothetical protein
MKTQTKQTIGFALEIYFFVLTGGHIANKHWGFMIISLTLAMMFAIWTGNLIKKQALEDEFK